MTVKELQKLLNSMDPEATVLCYSEDKNLLSDGVLFRIFNIEAVGKTYAEQTRLDDETPYLRLGKGEQSVELVTLEVTGDF